MLHRLAYAPRIAGPYSIKLLASKVTASGVRVNCLPMAYFPDLSPYSYGHHAHPGVVHVGWLDGIHLYSTGAVDVQLVEKIAQLASKPVELYRGKHTCELCAERGDLIKVFLPNGIVVDPQCSWARWYEQRSSNGEFRVAREGVVYAAPVLILHYILVHHYLPPHQFLRAIEEAP